MLEESAQDAHDTNVIGDARNAGPQATGVAHDQVDAHAGARGAVERGRDVGVFERVHLHLDQARRVGRVSGDLALDLREDRLLERRRRGQQLSVRPLRPVAGRQVVEELGEALADRRVARDEAEVAVDARGLRVVVAGAEVRVPAEAVEVPPHDEDHLAVRLQADDAVRDVDSDVI